MKSYFRYEPSKRFGVINSPQCNILYDWSGNLGFTGGLQDVCIWNIRQSSQISSLSYELVNYPYSPFGEVSVLCNCQDKTLVAAGYSTGEIRIFDFVSKSCKAVLRGHRVGVSVLATPVISEGQASRSTNVYLMASGGRDNDIIIWDLVAFSAVCRLRGHKDVITGIAFIKKDDDTLSTSVDKSWRLVSCSKDTLLKVWDLETQVCLQTVTGHRCEIWSLSYLPEPQLVVTGAADEQLRAYRIRLSSQYTSSSNEGQGHPKRARQIAPGQGMEDSREGGEEIELGDSDEVLEYLGAYTRQVGGGDKCAGVFASSCGRVLAAQSSGKTIDLYRVRSLEEISKKLKRKAKRIREKHTKKETEGDAAPIPEPEHETETADALTIALIDFLEPLPPLRCSHKIRSFCFHPEGAGGGARGGGAKGEMAIKAMVSLVDNVVEVYSIPFSISSPSAQLAKKVSVLELQGHRSDVRAVAMSSDGMTLATCSNDGVKIWSLSSFLCMRTYRGGGPPPDPSSTNTSTSEGAATTRGSYGVSLVFAPGDRFILLGTRQGAVQVVDVASGDLVTEVPDAHGGAVWSLSVRPDGKGLMSGGGDRLVRFWDFAVAGGKLGLTLCRELAMSQDVLCAKYSNTKSQVKLMLAVGLLDCTVKVFFDDSLKFFLSLYGHKLPVTCLDISTDSTLLATGSADKTIKLWGLDFGDCHRSLLGHEDTITAIRWQPNTHLFFSTSKDGALKYWDGDRFEQILHLPGHIGPVWSVDIAPDAATVISSGADRSVRVWLRSEDLVFVQEEKERFLEAQAERALESEAREEPSDNSGAVVVTTMRSVDTVKGAERLIDVLEKQQQLEGSAPQANQLSRSYQEYDQLRYSLRAIPAPDMVAALMELPLHLIPVLLRSLVEMCRRGVDLEVSARAALFLLRIHANYISMSSALQDPIDGLQRNLRAGLHGLRGLLGTNLAGLRLMERMAKEKQDAKLGLNDHFQDRKPVSGSSKKDGKKKGKKRKDRVE